MEVVGFIAAVGSIAKAGSAAVNFASKISKIAKEANGIGERIEKTSLHFRTVGQAILMAETSMKLRYPCTEDSPVICYMRDHHVLESLMDHSLTIRRDIAARRQDIKSIVSRFDLITSLKWTLMEQRITNLHWPMESLKTTLSMVLHIITLEITVAEQKEKPSRKQEKEIELLKRIIEEQIEYIGHLKRSAVHIEAANSSSNASVSSLSPQADHLKVICHLGHSLVEREVTPAETEPPESFSFQEAKRTRKYRRRHSTIQTRAVSRNISPKPADLEREPRPRPRPEASVTSKSSSSPPNTPNTQDDNNKHNNEYRHRSPSEAETFRSLPANIVGNDPPESRRRSRSPRRYFLSVKELHKAPDNSSAEFTPKTKLNGPPSAINPDDSSRNKTRKLKDQALNEDIRRETQATDHDATERQKRSLRSRPRSMRVETEPTPPQTPISPDQPSPTLTSGRSSSRRSRGPASSRRRDQAPAPPGGKDTISPSSHYDTVTGYVTIPKTGKKNPFEAHVDRQNLENLITLDYATKLGLIVERHPRRTRSYRDMEIEDVGKATVHWSTIAGITLVEPRSMDLIVVEELLYPLILGRWFPTAHRSLSREEARAEEEEGMELEADGVAGSSLG